ncbi:MAG: hypothetical protein IJ124_12990 [Clostridia bacterium]|nr:hypothetical protein [Clostridia bacterium]
MKAIQRILALTVALLLAVAACALGEETEQTEQTGLRRLRLGSSVYTVMIDDDFVSCDLTEEDIADDEIGYYQCDETGLDFDLYQFSKEGVAQELSHYTMEEANGYDAVEVVWPNAVINDIPVGWYRTRETWEGVEYDTATYILDNGDDYVELVFWMEDEDDAERARQIMESLQYIELQEIRLGDSSFTLTLPDDYVQGSMTPEDMMDDQVAYWYSDATLLDFDVYQFSKAGLSENLADYAAEEAAACYGVTELVTDEVINLIPVAHYRAVEEFEEGEYDTLTYIMDDGDEYVEIVFWLDGLTAEAEADYIIHNLIDESLFEADGEEEAAALPEGVTPVTWDVTPEHPMIDTDEARALYERIVAEDYPTMEELLADPVVAQLDALSAYYRQFYGNTADIDTPEREELREELKNWFLGLGSARTESVDENGKHSYVYDGPLNRDFQMELVLGLPASGKSTRVADPDSEAMGAFILDVDMIKAEIPEYKESHGAGADAVHFEGFAIFNRALDAFLTGEMKGVNIVLPIVGTDLDEMMQQYILPFEAAGYNVKARFCPAKENEAAARVVMRELGGGQLINSKVAFNFGAGPENVYNELKDMINSYGEPYGYEEDAALEPAA